MTRWRDDILHAEDSIHLCDFIVHSPRMSALQSIRLDHLPFSKLAMCFPAFTPLCMLLPLSGLFPLLSMPVEILSIKSVAPLLLLPEFFPDPATIYYLFPSRTLTLLPLSYSTLCYSSLYTQLILPSHPLRALRTRSFLRASAMPQSSSYPFYSMQISLLCSCSSVWVRELMFQHLDIYAETYRTTQYNSFPQLGNSTQRVDPAVTGSIALVPL